MDYRQARDYVKQASGAGIRPGLARIRRLLMLLGDPQDQKPLIHVAGTNGKGSVCSFLASVFHAAGICAGRYFSPSVLGYREMIQTDGAWIPREDFAECMTRIDAVICRDQELSADRPTAFELETAAAFLYLARSRADILVIETGMGGREDATNVAARPLACILTSVSMDHMSFLGDDLARIAWEKGGIIKEGVPLICWDGNEEVTGVISGICRERKAPLYLVREEEIGRSRLEGGIRCFDYAGFSDLKTGMPAGYMPQNAALAVRCLLLLKELGAGGLFQRITEEALRTGIRQAAWPGRFERVCTDPVYMLDGAHNPDGARALAESAGDFFREKSPILVMSVFADKDYPAMLRQMRSVSDRLIVFRAPGKRGLDEELLAQAAEREGFQVIRASSCRQAVETALQMAGEEDRPVLQFGTLSVLAQVKDLTGGR